MAEFSRPGSTATRTILAPRAFSEFSILLLSALFFVFQLACYYFECPQVAIISVASLFLLAVAIFEKYHTLVFFFFIANIFSLFFFQSRFFGFSLIEVFSIALLGALPFIYFSEKKRMFFRKYPYMTNYLLIVGSLVMALAYAYSHGFFMMGSLKYSIKFSLFFIPFFTLYALLNAENFRKYLAYYLVSGIIFLVLLYGSIIVNAGEDYGGRLFLEGALHPNWIAIYLELFFPLAFFLFLGSRRFVSGLMLMLLSIIFLVSLLLTFSKGGLITVAVCFLFFFFRKFSVGKLLLGLLMLVPSFFYFKEGFAERFTTQDFTQVMSSVTRIELFSSAYEMAKNTWFFFGYGLNAFAKLKFHFGFQGFLDPEHAFSPHNIYLELLVSMGIVGCIAFFIFLSHLIFRLFTIKPVQNEQLKYGLAFSIISYLIHGLVDCVIIVPTITISFFTIVAFSVFYVEHWKALDRKPLF